MPDFPRYQSKGQLTTQQTSFLAPKDTSAEVIAKVGEVGQPISEAAVKWSNAIDAIQTTTATANFKSGLADVLNRAQNDPDYNNSDQYFQEIDKLKRDNLRGFSSKAAETEAALNFGYESKVAQIQIQNLYKKKMIDVGQASTLKLLDMEANSPNEGFQNRISDILDKQVKAGVIGHEDAYKLQREYEKKGKNNAFLMDMNNDPEAAAKNLSKNTYGFDVKEQAYAKKLLEGNTKRQEEARKQAQMQTVNSFGEKLAARTLTSQEIEEATASGLIDANMALNFQLATAGPEKWNEFAKEETLGPRAKIMTDLLGKLEGDDVAGRTKIINSALQNYNDKKINADDLTFILRVGAGKSTDPQNPIWGFLKSAVGMIEPVKQSGKIMEKFKQRWDFKEDPRYTMQQAAIDQFKEDRPETASYQVGDTIKRKSGSFEVIGFNEDGSPVFKKK